MGAADARQVVVRLVNRGTESWPVAGPHPVNLGYRWRHRDAGAAFEGRAALPAPLAPAEQVDVPVDLVAPERAGAYTLILAPVQEGVAWFDAREPGSGLTRHVDVRAPVPAPEGDLEALERWLEATFPPPVRPWGGGGYAARYWAFLRAVLPSPTIRELLRDGRPLPRHYGLALDERTVEFPWLLAQDPRGRLLDAGSTLNHELLVDALLPRLADLHVVTLRPEAEAFWARGISYVFADLRDLPYRDGLFDVVACLSTLEHVGMRNELYGDERPRAVDPDAERLRAVQELLRVLRPGGRLLLTVPFGPFEDRGWYVVFDPARLDAIREAAAPATWSVEVFRHGPGGWRRADLREEGGGDPREGAGDAREEGGAGWGGRAAVAPEVDAVACVRLSR